MNKKLQQVCCFCCIGLMTVGSLTGCQKAEKKTEIVLTTDFKADEIFRINHASCTIPEMTVYMRTLQDQYESVFGNEIWQEDLGGVTLGTQLKDTILARLAQIKVMTLLAEDRGITLSEQENKLVDKAAAEYLSGLSAEEVESMSIDLELVKKLYGENFST